MKLAHKKQRFEILQISHTHIYKPNSMYIDIVLFLIVKKTAQHNYSQKHTKSIYSNLQYFFLYDKMDIQYIKEKL